MKGLVEGVNHAFKIQSSYTFKFHSKKKKKKKTNFCIIAIVSIIFF
jgi:hypothetical protein